MVDHFNTELIIPSDLHDPVSTQQEVDTDELMLNVLEARKLLPGNENRYAKPAMDRAVTDETHMKSKEYAIQKHAQYVRAQRPKDESKNMKKENIGSIVTLKMDYSDVSNQHGIPVIGFAISTNELGQGIQAVTDHDIMFSGKGRMRR